MYIYVHAYPVKLEPEICKLIFLVLRFSIFACSDFSSDFACVWEVLNTSCISSLLSDMGAHSVIHQIFTEHQQQHYSRCGGSSSKQNKAT